MSDILFIAGSPKRRNNDKAVERMKEIALQEGFKFTDQISLSDTQTKPCTDCDHCRTSHTCTDDAVNQINKKLQDARSIIITSPVYFGNVSSQLKALFDCTRPLRRHSMKLQDKIGAAIAIGAARNGGQETTIQAIHNWMLIHGMMIVGDNSHYGGTLQAPITSDDWGMETLEETVRKVCRTLSFYQ